MGGSQHLGNVRALLDFGKRESALFHRGEMFLAPNAVRCTGHLGPVRSCLPLQTLAMKSTGRRNRLSFNYVPGT